MPTARRSRRLAAAPDAVWAVVSDPRHLTRWWPHVLRVEAVTDAAFTEVLQREERPGGRPVRADFRVVVQEPPHRRVWEQQLEDSPFARVFTAVRVSVAVRPRQDGTAVELQIAQRLRGSAWLGAPLVRRASVRVLDDALHRLATLLEDG